MYQSNVLQSENRTASGVVVATVGGEKQGQTVLLRAQDD